MEGRYIYCVAEGDEELTLGRIGIEENQVYTVASGGLSAVVHNALDNPPDCRDREKVIGWVVSHQEVLDNALKRFGTILPIRFHTVIKGGTEGVKGWLTGNHGELLAKVARLKGREEYGVQIFWDEDVIAARLTDAVPSLRDLRVKADGGSGAAYMHGQLLEKGLKRQLEKEAARVFEDIYNRVREVAERIVVEDVKGTDNGLRMIMNLSVLLPREGYADLKEELERIDRMEGMAVRITGPWPPYSFAGI